jgi:hypothetical protein
VLIAASAFFLVAAGYVFTAYLRWQGLETGIWWWLRLLAALSTGCLALLHLWAWFHRHRPVLEVSDEQIEWGSNFDVLAARKRVSPREVTDVSRAGRWRVALRTRAGETFKMNLAELAPEERQKAFESIHRRVQGGSR